jgi:hypothetical protein
MKLYTAASTEYARHVIDRGFAGMWRDVYDPDELDEARRRTPEGQPVTDLPNPIDTKPYCEFRDIPSSGLTFSRTTETDVAQTGEDSLKVTISGGPTLADDIGDFTLEIEVPADFALEREVHEDPPLGWPFREFWLTREEANRFLDTLKVYDSADGEEVRPDLVGK